MLNSILSSILYFRLPLYPAWRVYVCMPHNERSRKKKKSLKELKKEIVQRPEIWTFSNNNLWKTNQWHNRNRECTELRWKDRVYVIGSFSLLAASYKCVSEWFPLHSLVWWMEKEFSKQICKGEHSKCNQIKWKIVHLMKKCCSRGAWRAFLSKLQKLTSYYTLIPIFQLFYLLYILPS